MVSSKANGGGECRGCLKSFIARIFTLVYDVVLQPYTCSTSVGLSISKYNVSSETSFKHCTPRKYWLITQEAMAPSRHDWKIVDWDVKPQHNQQTIKHCDETKTSYFFFHKLKARAKENHQLRPNYNRHQPTEERFKWRSPLSLQLDPSSCN